MRKLFLIVMVIVPIAYCVHAEEKNTAPATNKVSTFMRAKLLHSQKLLEALAFEDFDQMSKQSQEISLLSQESTWNVLETPEYIQQSTEFRRRADALTEAARNKNLEGASLAYVEMTLKCVQCHKYVRKARMTEGTNLKDSLPAKSPKPR